MFLCVCFSFMYFVLLLWAKLPVLNVMMMMMMMMIKELYRVGVAPRR